MKIHMCDCVKTIFWNNPPPDPSNFLVVFLALVCTLPVLCIVNDG